jgi:hypothetical protein
MVLVKQQNVKLSCAQGGKLQRISKFYYKIKAICQGRTFLSRTANSLMASRLGGL